MGPCAAMNQRPGENSSGPRPQIFSLGKSSTLFAALGGLLSRLLGRLLLGCFFGSSLRFLFRFFRRRFFSRRFFLGRGFRRGERRLRSARGTGALGDDQLLFGFLFDHFFRIATEFFFLKMHELVFVALVFFFVGHPRSPFDSSPFRGIRWRVKPSRAYKRNPACLSSVSRSTGDSELFFAGSRFWRASTRHGHAGRDLAA